MATKNKPDGSENDFHDLRQRDDNGTSLLFLRAPREREMIPNIGNKTVLTFVSREKEAITYQNLHQFLGSPEYEETDKLSDEAVSVELERLMRLMEERRLELITFTRISDRELHRFITAELFPQLTCGDKMVIMGELVYEEFHPNEHYLIKRAASNFLRSFLGQEAWGVTWENESELENKKALIRFSDQYDSVYMDKFGFDELAIEDGQTASLIFEISFYAHSDDYIFVHHFEGDGKIHLRKVGDEWRITRVHLPERVG